MQSMLVAVVVAVVAVALGCEPGGDRISISNVCPELQGRQTTITNTNDCPDNSRNTQQPPPVIVVPPGSTTP